MKRILIIFLLPLVKIHSQRGTLMINCQILATFVVHTYIYIIIIVQVYNIFNDIKNKNKKYLHLIHSKIPSSLQFIQLYDNLSLKKTLILINS